MSRGRGYWSGGMWIDRHGRAWDQVDLALRDQRVADMLEEMAPGLLRINPGAFETAARIRVRLL